MLNSIFGLTKDIDAVLGSFLPEAVRACVYGVLAGACAIGIYYLTSNQSKIATLKEEIKALQQQLFKDDLKFSDFFSLSMKNLKTSTLLLIKALVPALLSSIPVILFIILLPVCFSGWELPFFIAVLVTSIGIKLLFRIQ